MRAQLQLVKPKELQAAVTMVAPLTEWERLADQLPDDWPAGDFRRAIREAITKANNIFYGESEKAP